MSASAPINTPGKSRFHSVYRALYQSWIELESAIASIPITKDKGDAFEQFCYFYFVYHKDLYGIDEVWSDKVKGREIPQSIRTKYQLEKRDFGVDGVNVLKSGEIEAWQSKFHSDRSSATYSELATFYAEAEHAHYRRVIANCKALPEVAQKKKGHRQTLVDRFTELERPFFEALYQYTNQESDYVLRKVSSPRPHQQAMIQNVVSGLAHNDRGKLIAACGTGKTLAALWITESEELGASRVLVLAPSIALVGQTVREWVMNRTIPFNFLCVCSDTTVGSGLEVSDESYDISVHDLDVPVTTSSVDIAKWLEATKAGRQYIFSTYHSVGEIENAVKTLADYQFDIIFFDEAHRTVGSSDHRFSLALKDDRIPAKKRLFMTATERLINPRVVTLAQAAGQEVFSMSDEAKYGPTLYEYNFGSAIQDGVIADYEIMLVEITGQSEIDLIDANRLLQIGATGSGDAPIVLRAADLLKVGFLLKAIEQAQVSKVISFHDLQRTASAFSRCIEVLSQRLPNVASKLPFITYVLGTHPAAERADRISKFEQSAVGILSNVQVLSEGVDIPLVDAIYFVDPKRSLIDLVQAIGRALRKPYGSNNEKVARIIVPVQVPQGAESLEDINWDETLQTFHSVIQAMRAQDQRLAEEINQINLYEATKGRRGFSAGSGSKVKIHVPQMKVAENIDLASFIDRITLRIATANANPDGTKLGFSHLGKGERRSEYEPLYGVIGDYTPDVLKSQLVDPTIMLFADAKEMKPLGSIRVNNNNVSHTRRLGLIREQNKKLAILTVLGRAYKEGRFDFDDVLRNQMMLYSTDNGLFTYRVVIQLLIALGSLSHKEFLYGPYMIQRDASGYFDSDIVIERILHIRDTFPSIEITSLANRDEVRDYINNISPISMSDSDVWGDRSTPANKFRYLKKMLSLFKFIEVDSGSFRTPLRIKENHQSEAMNMLEISDPRKAPVHEYYGTWYWQTEETK